MNRARRNKIDKVVVNIKKIILELDSQRDKETYNKVLSDVRNVLADEEMAFDSMPDNLKPSMKGQESEEAIDYLTEAESILEDIDFKNDNAKKIKEKLNEVVENLESIA